MPLKLLKLLSCFKKNWETIAFSREKLRNIDDSFSVLLLPKECLCFRKVHQSEGRNGKTSPSGDEMKLVFVHKKDPRLYLKYFAFPTFFSTSLHFLTFFSSRAAMARLPRGYPPGEPARSLTSESTGYSRRSGRETLPKSSSPNTFPPGRR